MRQIFQDLHAEVGFSGSYQSVKRYVGQLRRTQPELVCRIEVAAGEEVQVDFGAGPLLAGADGKRYRTWIFRMVLSHSRKGYTEAVRRQDTESLLQALENGFRHFGGVTLTVSLDNLKAAVLRYDWAEPELNPKLRDFTQHCATSIRPCWPRTPEDKGKVEKTCPFGKRAKPCAGKWSPLTRHIGCRHQLPGCLPHPVLPQPAQIQMKSPCAAGQVPELLACQRFDDSQADNSNSGNASRRCGTAATMNDQPPSRTGDIADREPGVAGNASRIGGSQNSSSASKFALSAKARELAGIMSAQLIAHYRNVSATAKTKRAEAIRQATGAIAKAKAEWELRKSGATQNLQHDLSEVQRLVELTSSILADAKSALENTGVELPPSTPPPLGAVSLQKPPIIHPVNELVSKIKARLADFDRQTQQIGTDHALSYWPNDVGARWAVGLSIGFSVILFSSFYGLGLLWFPIVYLTRRGRPNRLIHKWNIALQEARQLHADLLSINSQIQATYDASLQLADQQSFSPVRQKHQEAIAAANAAFEVEMGDLVSQLKPIVARVHQDAEQLWCLGRYATADWDSSIWNAWSPDTSPEFAARIGVLGIGADDLKQSTGEIDWNLKLPALIPFADGKCLMLSATSAQKGTASTALQSLLLRVLASTPPGKARFTLLDPVGLGHNVADLLHLGDIDSKLISGRAWTEPHHIEQQLAKLTEEMEVVIQTYLRKDYSSILEFNAAHQDIAEPFRFLVVFDFPVNFTESAARRLSSIVKNGPRCGVFTFIVRDSAKPLPHGINQRDLEESAIQICVAKGDSTSSSTDGFIWNEPEFRNYSLKLDELPPSATARRIVLESGTLAVKGMRREVPFEALIAQSLKPDSWRTCSAASGLCVTLGPAGRSKPQELILGGGQEAHALLVGRTGSGKTNLMHVIITNLALTYSPIELELYLIDFKGGVGFKRYAEHQLPHAKVIAIESEREFGMSVLRGLDTEIKRRSELFRAAGVESFAAFRSKDVTGPCLPRILLIVDEFQEFFTDNDDMSQQAKLIFDRLARQGRSFGIHFLLATQSLSGSAQLHTSVMGQIKVRIALPCSEADSRLILTDDNKAARSLSRPGEAIYNPMAGAIEGNSPFQVALFSEEQDLKRYLAIVAKIASEHGITKSPIIFEGNEHARIEDCKPLAGLLTSSERPVQAKSIDLFLGEPIAIAPPVAAKFRRQSGSNLLIVNREESEGIGICMAALLSVLSQQRPENCRILVADFSTSDSEWSEHGTTLAQFFPASITVVRRQREFGTILAKTFKEINAREDGNSSAKPTFILLQGMHRIKALRENSEDEDGNNAVELLQTLLREGPESGIHVIAWADTVPNVTRGLGRKVLNEFGFRIGSVMSGEDSMNLLDNMAASKIVKSNRAIFLDEDRPGQLTIFRPYAMPSATWLTGIAERLRTRTTTVTTV